MRSVSLRSILFTTCLASTFVLPFTMGIGHAGFEWIPPAEKAAPQVQEPVMQMPAAPPPAAVSAEMPAMPPPARMQQNTAPAKLLPLEPLPGIDDLAPPAAPVVRNKIVMPEDAPKDARQSYDDVVTPSS